MGNGTQREREREREREHYLFIFLNIQGGGGGQSHVLIMEYLIMKYLHVYTSRNGNSILAYLINYT